VSQILKIAFVFLGSALVLCGDPGGSRTPNPQIRSLMLYPVELRGRGKFALKSSVHPSRALARLQDGMTPG
jgi:hypothetical protein